MVQIVLMENLRCKVLAWDYDVVPTKEPGKSPGKQKVTNFKIKEVGIQIST